MSHVPAPSPRRRAQGGWDDDYDVPDWYTERREKFLAFDPDEPAWASIPKSDFGPAGCWTGNPGWHLDRVDQAVGCDGHITKVDAHGTRVFVLDTGIHANHPDFDGLIDPDSPCHRDFTKGAPPLWDEFGHGTWVAGAACGHKFGIAKNCELCSVKVLHDGTGGIFGDIRPLRGLGYKSAVVAGIEFVARQCRRDELCVLNLSASGGPSSSIDRAVAAAVRDGVVVVGAAGNNWSDACAFSPGREPQAITVGESRAGDSISYNANKGPCINVYAPGYWCVSAWPDGGYQQDSGSSFSTAMVSGIAAGKIGSGGAKKPPEVRDMIVNNAVSSWDDYAREEHIRHFGWHGWHTWYNTGILDLSYNYQLTQGIVSVLEGLTSPPPPAPEVCDGVPLEVELRSDRFPLENHWKLTGDGPCNGGYHYAMWPDKYWKENYQRVKSLCVPPGPYKFEIFDDGGDGIGMGELWNEAGHYKVSLNDEVVAHGKDIGALETTLFTTDECPPCDGSWFQVNIQDHRWSRDPGGWVLTSTRLCNGETFDASGGASGDTEIYMNTDPICLPPGEYMFTMRCGPYPPCLEPDRNSTGWRWGKSSLEHKDDDAYYAVFMDGAEIVRSSNMAGDETMEFSTNKGCPVDIPARPTNATNVTTDAPTTHMETSVAGTRFEFTPSDACTDPTDGRHSIGKINQCLQGCALLSKCTGFMARSDGCSLSFGVPAECGDNGIEAVFWSKSTSESPFTNVEMMKNLLNDRSYDSVHMQELGID